MSAIVSLFATKKWAAVRNVFTKPVSAILTLLVLGVYDFSLVPMLSTGGKAPMDAATLNLVALLALGMSLFFILTNYLSKNRALFFVQDSYYMFTGPFTQKQVLSYLIFDAVLSALMMGGMSLILVALFSMSNAIGIGLLLQMLLALVLAQYVFTAFMEVIYIRDMVRGHKGKGMLLTMGVVLASIVAAMLYVMAQNGFDSSAALAAFPESNAVYFIPVLGWAKLAVTGGAMGAVIGYGLLAVCSVAISALLVNLKGDFYEPAMLDAENFTEYYQKAKSGQIAEKVKKGEVNINWQNGVGAIHSKNWLIARKTTLLRPYDLIVIGAYVGWCVWMGAGLLILVIMLLFYQFATASSSSLVEDLKYPYIYLMPGSPLKKLLNSLAVPLVKNMLIVGIAVTLSGIFMREVPLEIVACVLLSASFSLMTTFGNVFALRVMRSRNNAMVEQTLRMVLVLLGLVPSIGVLILALRFLSLEMWMAYALVAVVNILVGVLGLLACSPMMNGRELSSD